MTDEPVWNDESREDLREALRSIIRGELRTTGSLRRSVLVN